MAVPPAVLHPSCFGRHFTQNPVGPHRIIKWDTVICRTGTAEEVSNERKYIFAYCCKFRFISKIDLCDSVRRIYWINKKQWKYLTHLMECRNLIQNKTNCYFHGYRSLLHTKEERTKLFLQISPPYVRRKLFSNNWLHWIKQIVTSTGASRPPTSERSKKTVFENNQHFKLFLVFYSLSWWYYFYMVKMCFIPCSLRFKSPRSPIGPFNTQGQVFLLYLWGIRYIFPDVFAKLDSQ